MRQESVERILRMLGVDQPTKPSGDAWLMASCPLAPTRHKSGQDRRPSLAVSVGPGASYVLCHSCGVKGHLRRLVREVRADGLITERVSQRIAERLKWVDSHEPRVEDEPPDPPPPMLDPRVLNHLAVNHRYFQKRKFSVNEVREWRLGKWNKRVVLFPCVLSDGSVPYVQARYVKEKTFWWMPKNIKRQHVCGTHLLSGSERRIIVVEGVFDAMRVRRALKKLRWLNEYGVVAMWGSKPNEMQRQHLFSLVRDELILLTDNDEAGDLSAEKLEMEARSRVPRVSRVFLPRKVKDADEAGTKRLMQLLPKREDLLVRHVRILSGMSL